MASVISRRLFSTSARRFQEHTQQELRKESRRNPEIMILGGVMVAALGGAGFYFGRSPTHSTSEAPVKIAQGGMPWESDAQGKYKYHPGGDPNAEPRDAPSALNVVVVPNVTLPKELHDKYNKWGKDGYP
ncbi:hypothetical protein VFPFJ_06011 [Purpureocillium lilacinum]|uniref:Uncharacterized protein n=1 Tax=Purpureocillium lilacinum TaxID=33203 RepID=A0A179HHA9_PURLI|nr:hypothetical protein VFPFJ_06011 [Purpureocillium lilacinum]KAK4081506.1 hypothetical protein Purlil1_11596 [Purpureocillium lilacinum]OAQ85051.1 hypothetical protein VFPBJ_03824 [Purpureocillium lilacinum]OAQ89597.1 hypothetical protein VFPFJ_06011 [Purpureocillium lilacinum]PWI67988.1 hypothetical protein PCL_02389 [Purpureocillium lilacinum]GJN69298.1 hypothetical protein PLICBS_003346 [Purpureocillium lilacinum]